MIPTYGSPGPYDSPPRRAYVYRDQVGAARKRPFRNRRALLLVPERREALVALLESRRYGVNKADVQALLPDYYPAITTTNSADQRVFLRDVRALAAEGKVERVYQNGSRGDPIYIHPKYAYLRREELDQ